MALVHGSGPWVWSTGLMRGFRTVEYRDNAMYIGYAPAESPEVVIAVAIENVVGGGGSIAAPAARRLLDTWHKRYHPEQYEEVESAND